MKNNLQQQDKKKKERMWKLKSDKRLFEPKTQKEWLSEEFKSMA